MAIVKVEGKEVTLPDDVVKAGKAAIKALLAVNGFPAIENAHIEIAGGENGAPAIVNVTPRSTGKGGVVLIAPDISAPSPYDSFLQALVNAPAYVNPAIALAAQIERAERDGDTQFVEQVIKSSRLERAVLEGLDEGTAVRNALSTLCRAKPEYSKTVPVGF
jgi:hypothetical protein